MRFHYFDLLGESVLPGTGEACLRVEWIPQDNGVEVRLCECRPQGWSPPQTAFLEGTEFHPNDAFAIWFDLRKRPG